MGDVYVSTALRNHDRRIELPVFDAYGVWEVASPPAPRLIQALGLKSGIVSSGNSLNCGTEDRAALDASGACLKEMEGAAIAYVAHLFGMPLLAVKAVTDIVDGDRVSGAHAHARRAVCARRCHAHACSGLRCGCVRRALRCAALLRAAPLLHLALH